MRVGSACEFGSIRGGFGFIFVLVGASVRVGSFASVWFWFDSDWSRVARLQFGNFNSASVGVGSDVDLTSVLQFASAQRWLCFGAASSARLRFASALASHRFGFVRFGSALVLFGFGLLQFGSQGDALLTAALLTKAGRRLRFVLKRQLLTDPCLDVVGHRIPNYFVDRDSSDNHQELLNINVLAADLDDDEALVVFPEGTRFSPTKLVNAVAAVAETAPARTAAIMNLRSVLPLRTAGTLAALEATEADIVICNHVGIDDISSLNQLREAVPLRRPLKFKLWRTRRSDVPPRQREDELIKWLDHQWSEVDEWVTRNQ